VQTKLRSDLEMTLEQWLIFEIELTGYSYLASATEFPERILLNVLKNRDSTITLQVLKGLGRRLNLPDNCLAPILSRLQDSNPSVRLAAAEALASRTDDPPVRQALLARLEDPNSIVRRRVFEALGSRADDPQIRQALLTRLEDPDQFVISAAAEALGSQTNDPQIRQTLLAKLEDPNHFVRCAAIKALSSRAEIFKYGRRS
jgi:vesicle coat complex subunit